MVFRFEGKHNRTDYIGTNIQDPTREQVAFPGTEVLGD